MDQLKASPEGLTFPCSFPIKAMGRNSDELRQTVLEIVQRHAPELSADTLTTAESRGGRFISVTATITASSRAQLDAIYGELKAHDSVLATL